MTGDGFDIEKILNASKAPPDPTLPCGCDIPEKQTEKEFLWVCILPCPPDGEVALVTKQCKRCKLIVSQGFRGKQAEERPLIMVPGSY